MINPQVGSDNGYMFADSDVEIVEASDVPGSGFKLRFGDDVKMRNITFQESAGRVVA